MVGISPTRGESKNAEEWYGTMVHEILFRRLGLLVRDETGRYRMSHQLIEEYLAIIHRGFEREICPQGKKAEAAFNPYLCALPWRNISLGVSPLISAGAGGSKDAL